MLSLITKITQGALVLLEQYKGKNSLLRQGVLVLGGCEYGKLNLETRCLLLWWLALFIEALVLFPNIEREGSQQRPF